MSVFVNLTVLSLMCRGTKENQDLLEEMSVFFKSLSYHYFSLCLVCRPAPSHPRLPVLILDFIVLQISFPPLLSPHHFPTQVCIYQL